MGRDASAAGSIWWGYTGAIQCPDDSETLRAVFVDVFQYVAEAFAKPTGRDERTRVVRELAVRCEAAQRDVDRQADADASLDVLAAYHCLLHIWDRLRIWAPGADEPERHPGSNPPSLFFAE